MRNDKTTWTLAAVLLLAAAAVAAAAEQPRTVEITVTDEGYQPARIALTAGQPVRLAFRNEASLDCAASVHSEALGIEATDLPKGETTIIELTPPTAGGYTFACSMDMMTGAVIVAAP